MNLGPAFQYAKSAFSDNGTPSSSRLLTLFHSLVSCGCLIFVIAKNHVLPDGMALTGLGAFVTAPYAINRASNMLNEKKDKGSAADLAQLPSPKPPDIGS